MPDLNFRLVITTDGAQQKIKLVKQDADALRSSLEEPSDLYVLTNDADGKLRLVKQQAADTAKTVETPSSVNVDDAAAAGKLNLVKQQAESTAKTVETPRTVRVDAAAALATLRDLTLTVAGITTAFAGLARGVSGFLDAELSQRRALTLAKVAFGEAAGEMAAFASEMQSVTNFGDEEMLSMFAKMSQTFKLSADEIQKLTPGLLDFTEATAATGMTMETAFDLMGRALNGHTEMLGRHGIELDKDRLAMEGVSYLVQKLAEDYGGTATALADLRTQNRNAWGDIREDVGSMLAEIFNPILSGIRSLMDAFNSLSPAMKGVVAGLALAIPTIAAVATAIVALTAAVHALKIAINPIAGIISLITGAAVTGAVAYGAYSAAAKKASDASADASAATQNLDQSLKSCGTAVQVESEKFNVLAARLLDLRSKTQLTNDEKRAMKTLVGEINSSYGQYLGNINLETAAYDKLATAITNTSNALIAKAVAENYGRVYSAQVDAIAKLTVAAQEKYGMARANEWLAEPFKRFTATVKTGFETMGIAETNYYAHYPEIRQIVDAKRDLLNIEQKMQEALKNVPTIKLPTPAGGSGGGGSFSSAVVGDVPAALSDFDRLLSEIQSRATDAYAALDAEDRARRELVWANTAEDSQERRDAIAALDAWYLEELAKLDSASVEAVQSAFKAQIDHFANLAELGVGTYAELKKAMEDYYAWAKENLSEEDATAVLLQLKQANLRWGAAQQEKIDRELAHLRELEDLRDEFSKRDFALRDDDYAAALLELERYYERKRAALIAAGISEAEIEQQQQDARAKLRADHDAAAARSLQDTQDEFARREFALRDDNLAAAVMEIERYYDRNNQLLLDAGFTQAQITSQQQAELAKIRREATTASLQELQDIQDDFARRSYDLAGNAQAAALLDIERYYDRNKALMIKAGIAEIEIERQKQEAIKKVKFDTLNATTAGISQILGNLAAAQDQESERGFKTWKAIAIAQGYVDTFSSAIAAYRAMVGIPGIGPGLAVAAAAAALAAGLANIARISSQKYEKKALGGILSGPSHAQGGTLIEAEGGEYVIRKSKVRALGQPIFDFLNFAPVSAVREALSNLRLPSLPLPAAIPSFAFASGGPVPQTSNASLPAAAFDALNATLAKLSAKLDELAAPNIHVSVDPLDNHPVTISQLAERGSRIRSTY